MPAPRPGGAAARAYPLARGGRFPAPGIRQRAQPRLPAAAARPQRGRATSGRGATSMLGPRPVSSRSTGPRELRLGLRGDARRGIHAPSASSTTSASPEAHAAAAAAAERGRRARAPLRRLRARRHRSVPAGAPSPTTCAGSRSYAPRASASASPPTPCAPARGSGSRSSARTRRSTGCRCTCTPTSSRARSRSACAEHGLRPIELLAECGCLGPRTTVVHATHADGRELDLLAAGRRPHLRVPDDRGEPRRRLPAGRTRAPPRHRPLHRLRLERAHRPVRGAARARRHRAAAGGPARRAHGRRPPLDRLRRGRGVTRPRRLAVDRDRRRITRSCAASTSPLCALVHGCSADVVLS